MSALRSISEIVKLLLIVRRDNAHWHILATMASEEFGFDADEFEKNATSEAKKGMLARACVWSMSLCIVSSWHRPGSCISLMWWHRATAAAFCSCRGRRR